MPFWAFVHARSGFHFVLLLFGLFQLTSSITVPLRWFTDSPISTAKYVELVESIPRSESALPQAAAPTYEEIFEFLKESLGGDKAEPEVGEQGTKEFGVGEEELEGPTAVAVYDYDATEDNEISFKEGDVLWGIEVVSDEWWSGKVGQGAEETDQGLFPGESFSFSKGGRKPWDDFFELSVSPSVDSPADLYTFFVADYVLWIRGGVKEVPW